jgi:hypothetical protein
MKAFEHLNDQELVALDQDQINHYIKLKKAETGIRIITLPDPPTYQDVPAPDLELYEACGFSFADKTKAQEIADTVNKHVSTALKIDYDWSRGGSDYKYAKPYDGSLETVEIKRAFSQPVYNSIRDIITSNKKIKDAWEVIKKEYDGEEEKAGEIVESIYDSITKARDRIELFRNYKVRIIEYLQLANGDRDIAWNFFDKAYSVEPSVKTMIMESQEYQDAINSYINA